MVKQQDRVAQTEEAIVNSLIKVGKEKPLNQITITDLTRFSGISRGTFYLHYLDKNDLVLQIENKIIKQFEFLLNSEMNSSMDYETLKKGEPYSIVKNIIQLVDENKDLISFLFSANGDYIFYQKITLELQKSILKELKIIKGNTSFHKDLPEEYALKLVTNTIMTIITTWIMEDKKRNSEEVARLIMRALYLSPYDMLDIKS